MTPCDIPPRLPVQDVATVAGEAVAAPRYICRYSSSSGCAHVRQVASDRFACSSWCCCRAACRRTWPAQHSRHPTVMVPHGLPRPTHARGFGRSVRLHDGKSIRRKCRLHTSKAQEDTQAAISMRLLPRIQKSKAIQNPQRSKADHGDSDGPLPFGMLNFRHAAPEVCTEPYIEQ